MEARGVRGRADSEINAIIADLMIPDEIPFKGFICKAFDLSTLMLWQRPVGTFG